MGIGKIAKEEGKPEELKEGKVCTGQTGREGGRKEQGSWEKPTETKVKGCGGRAK